jgi:hypothetical protein
MKISNCHLNPHFLFSLFMNLFVQFHVRLGWMLQPPTSMWCTANRHLRTLSHATLLLLGGDEPFSLSYKICSRISYIVISTPLCPLYCALINAVLTKIHTRRATESVTKSFSALSSAHMAGQASNAARHDDLR